MTAPPDLGIITLVCPLVGTVQPGDYRIVTCAQCSAAVLVLGRRERAMNGRKWQAVCVECNWQSRGK